MHDVARVGVVIPAYNSQRFIDDTLASVARQSRRASEVIVADDGSTDQTVECAEAWADRFSPARFIVLRGPNAGVSVARNRGLLACTCDVVAFLDADDVFEPDHLATLTPAFALAPDISFAFGDMTRWGGPTDGRRLLDPIRDELHRGSRSSEIDGLLLLDRSVRSTYFRSGRIAPSSWLVARRALPASGVFDPALRYGEDCDFLFRLLSTGASVWCDRSTGKKREHGNNASSAEVNASIEAQLLFVLSRIRRFNHGLTAAERDAIDFAVDRAATEVQYLATTGGLASYLRSRKQAGQLIGRPAPFVPRQLLRSLLPSWLLTRRRQNEPTGS